jgi:hypothetical protein
MSLQYILVDERVDKHPSIKKTPRQELKELYEREKKNPDGHYGVNCAFINLIETRSSMGSFESSIKKNSKFRVCRSDFDKIYELLLDGTSVKEIKKMFVF